MQELRRLLSSLEPWVLSRRAAFVGFSILAIFWTWPVAATLSSRLPYDAGDSVLTTWFLWWNAQAVPFTSTWWSPPIMWPMPGFMALSEHLVGLSPVSTPLQLLGATPIAAYNVCFLLTYALSGFFAYLLVRRLTGSAVAGLCAGLAFGFSPYRASQLGHIHVLAAHCMPLALLGLHAYLETARSRWLVLFGVAWLLQALSNGYYMLFFPILIVLWLAWFVDWRHAPRRGLAILSAWVIASLPLLPMLLKYRTVHTALGLKRTVDEMRDFSAIPASFLHPSPMMKFWPAGNAANYEVYLFPGVMVVLLTLAGLAVLLRSPGVRAAIVNRSPLLFYTAIAILTAALTLGPGGGHNDPASPFRPYSWLLWLPGYDGLRVSSRFAMLTSLSLAVAASLSLARLRLIAVRWRHAIALAALGGILFDGFTWPVPAGVPPGRVILPGPAQSAVIELPPDSPDVSVGAMFRTTFHRHPLVNGYSGHVPPHYKILSLALWRGDTTPLLFLARRQPLVIIVNDAIDRAGFRAMVESMPGIESHGVSRAGSMFLLPAQPDVRLPPIGPAIPAEVKDAGRYRIEFDLRRSMPVSSVTFPLKSRYPDLAERILIETSDDGQSWTEAWRGWTGGMAMEAALADPQLVPMQIPLPGTIARYVRVYPASTWMKQEMVIR